MIPQGPTQISIGDQPKQSFWLGWVGDPATADGTRGEVADHIWQGRFFVECWELVSRHHQVGARHGELFAERSCGMVEREVRRGNPLALHPNRSQGIAYRHGNGGTGGGCKVEWADLPIHTGIQHHIAAEGQ